MSKLEDYLAKKIYGKFGHLYVRQNYRPMWMEGLELDFYIEELKLAAEIQGQQHFHFVEFFHKSETNFEKQKDRDAKKSIICRERRIKLVEIFTEKDADLFIEIVKEKTRPFLKYEELPKASVTKRDRSIERGMKTLAYINAFYEKVKGSGMKAYQKQIDKALEESKKLDIRNEMEEIAIKKLDEVISNIKEIIPDHDRRNKKKNRR